MDHARINRDGRPIFRPRSEWKPNQCLFCSKAAPYEWFFETHGVPCCVDRACQKLAEELVIKIAQQSRVLPPSSDAVKKGRNRYAEAIKHVTHELLSESQKEVLKCHRCQRQAIEEAVYYTGEKGNSERGIAYHCGSDLCRATAARVAVSMGYLHMGQFTILFTVWCAWDEIKVLIRHACKL